MTSENTLVALEALVEVLLAGHCVEDDVAFPVEELRSGLATGDSGSVIVCSDEEEALAAGRVSVHCDQGNTFGDRGIDLRSQHLSVGCGDENPGRVFADGAAKLLRLSLGVVARRADDLDGQVHLSGCAIE